MVFGLVEMLKQDWVVIYNYFSFLYSVNLNWICIDNSSMASWYMPFLITISVLFNKDNCDYYSKVYIIAIHSEPWIYAFWN